MSKFKKKFGKRILAFLLSGAMIMSNMTAFASEAPQDTGGEYVREETVVTDENDTEYVEETDADESSKSEDSTADKKDDVKETSAETVEATETSDSKETKETETAKEEQTSETESSLSADTETTDVEEETSEEEQTSETDNEEGEADADGFYNGLEATTVEAGKSYYYDFTGHGTIANTYEKGLFSFNAGSYHSAGYDQSKPENGIEFKSGNKLTFSVSGNSYIVVGGNNNNTCTDLAAAGDKGTMKPETLSTVTAGKAALSDCKEKGSNTLVYEYTGEAGKVTLTVDPSYTKAEGQTSTKAYITYVCVIPKEAESEDDEQPDADGFYNGLEATEIVAERPYYYDFTGHGTIANTYEKGLFSFNAGSYHSAGYDQSKPENGIEFKSGNKLTFSVSGNSYIVVGGNNNNTCTDLAAAGDKGTMKPETLSTVTAGKAALSDCKEKGSNTLVYEYTGEAGKVTLTVDPSYTKAEGQTSTKAYIAYVCVIPKEAGGEDETDTTHTSWKFSDADFQTEANKTSVSEYNGLKIDGGGAKAHNNKYLYVGTNGKVSIPVAGNGVVTVKTQYGDKFYFADKSDDVKEGVTDGTICTYTYAYTGKKGYVTLSVLATTYLTEISVEAIDTSHTSWKFSDAGFQTEENKTSVTAYNGLKIDGGGAKAHNDKYLYVGTNGKVSIPVAGNSVVTVKTQYGDKFYFADKSDDVKEGVTDGTICTYTYEYTGSMGYVTLTVLATTYLTEISVDTIDTSHTSWKFSDDSFQTEANKTSVTAYNGLKIDGGGAKAHNNKYLYVGTNGKVSIPVAGNSVVTVKTQYGDKFYFADKSDDVKEGVTDGTICTYTYEYTGGMGYVTLTVLATTYLTEITVEELEEGEPPVNPSTTVSGKNKDGKPDVWDFAGGATKLDENGVPTEYIDTEKYNNVLTEDIINSLYDAEPGKDGVPTSSFAVKNDKDEVLLEFNGGGKLTHRIRTENTKITRYDKSTKTDKDGVKYLGYVYSNASGKDLGPEYKSVYLGIMLEAGDVVTAVVGSNGNNSTIQFEPVDGSEEPQSFEFVPSEKANASIATFYATKTGEYKMYSVNEKLVVARVTVEKKDFVRVSGQVTAPESLTQKYSVSFKCKESGAVKTAKVVDGKYTVYLNEGYTYDVALSGADEYVVSNEQPYFTLSGEGIKEEEIEGVKEKTFKYDVSVEAVDLVTVTGNITGLEAVAGGSAEPIKNLDLIFESDMIYVPKLKINTDASFTLTLEKGVTYAVRAEGVDDFTLDTTTISANEDGTANIAFTPKPVYNVTIIPEGVTNEELGSTKFVFSRVYIEDSVKQYEEDYVYTFTGTNGIKLRDGQYEVKAENCPYTQLITSDLKVEGKDVEKTIRFSKDPITLWDFAAKDFVDVTNYKGLIMSGVQKNKVYALGGANGEFKIPVAGTCTVTAYYCYEATGTIGTTPEDAVKISLEKDVDDAYHSTSKEKASVYKYTGEAGYVTINTTAKTYMTKITVQYESDKVEYKEKVTVGASGCDYTSINDALDAVRKMDRPNGERVTIEIQPGDYEEMLVVDTPNVTLKNANADPSIMPINKGLDIEESSVRITSYYGHGYAYYSMGSDCKWNADILAANKENGCLSFENPGTGTTSGSYWNATVVIGADGFEADGIIFENSFNQYVSKKAANDVIVPLSGAKEGSVPRADMKAGDLTIQNKEYVERAAALAIMNNYKNINFNNCSFIGRQDTLYGGVEVRAAFYGCDIYGGTDYIYGGMDAVFAKCNLVFNTNDQTDKGKKDDVGYITAAQTASGRGLLLYNCTVTSTIPGVNTASEKTSKPGYLGRPWAANTGEAIFYKTIIETTDFNGTKESLIVPVGWASSLGGESVLSQEYASIELAGVDNTSQRAGWSSVLTADAEGKVKLADGNTVVTDDTVVAAFLGDWNPFAGKDMTINTPEVPGPDDPDGPDNPDNPDNPDKPDVVKTIKLDDCVIAVSSILADPKKNPENRPKTSVVYYADKDSEGNPIKPITFAEGLDYEVSKPEQKEDNTWSVTIKGLGREVDEYRIDPDSSLTRTFKVFDKKADKDKIIDLSKAKITLDTKSAVYTGYAIIPKVTVKVGKEDIADTKYKISYRSNINTGKASVIVSADSDAYVEGEKFVIGTKTVNFTIKKAAINKADQIKVTAKDANGKDLKGNEYDYRGVEAVVAETLLVESSAGKSLRENIDYTVTYKNNRKAGKASLVIKGIGNNVSGTLNIPFTIKPIEVNPETDVYAPYYGMEYSPNGAKAQFILFRRYTNASHTEIADEILLEEGVDFKGSYKYASKNKEAGSTVKFSGKGMNAFKGIFSESEYIIKPSYFTDGGVYVSSAITVDITKGDLEGAALQKALEKAVVLNDYFGTKLKVNKDYVIEPTVAEDGRGAVIIRPSDATKANYLDGDLSLGYYYNKAKNVGKLKKVEFAKDFVKYYDGRNPVQLTADDIKLLGTYEFELGTHVEIVPGSYKNNYKTGNASVTIRGIAKNGYYGTKTIKFKIKEA